jgi:hypothetical protein
MMSDEEIPIKDRVVAYKKRGRPPGVKNGEGVTEKWEPKEWKPEYEFIVALSCMGLSRGVIVNKLKQDRGVEYSEQQISNILNCKQAAVVKQMLVNQTRKVAYDTIEDQLHGIASKATARIEEVFNDDKVRENNPISVASLGIKFLQGVGKLNGQNANSGGSASAGGGVTTNIQNNILINAATDLAKALEASRRVAEIHSEVKGESIK